jgi:hypothetical protein
MDPAERSSAPGTGAVTRRRVVTTVGHTAWAAPVIVAASATPTFAGTPGAALISAAVPSTTAPTGSVRVSCAIVNNGTIAPPSMGVTVTLTPLIGTIQDVDPVMNDANYAFASRTVGAGGVQTLQFVKVDPQIAPGDSVPLRFSFVPVDDPVTTIKKGTISVMPTVPPPSTASGSSGDYE